MSNQINERKMVLHGKLGNAPVGTGVLDCPLNKPKIILHFLLSYLVKTAFLFNLILQELRTVEDACPYGLTENNSKNEKLIYL